jgi:hypothetical protein
MSIKFLSRFIDPVWRGSLWSSEFLEFHRDENGTYGFLNMPAEQVSIPGMN